MVAITFTLTVHEPFAGMVPPLKAIVVLPAVAPVMVPPQELERLGGEATCTPEGSESENEAPVRGEPFGFESVKVRVETPLTAINGGAKALLREGAVRLRAGQPVNTTLSREKLDVVFDELRESAVSRNQVIVPVSVVLTVAPVCHEPLVAVMVPTRFQVVPLLLA